MDTTMRVRRWAVLGAPVALIACVGLAFLLCGEVRVKLPWGLLLAIPVAFWWAAGAACLKPIRPSWNAGSARRLARNDRWLQGGLCAALTSGIGMTALPALYAPVIDFPGVLTALLVICALVGQCAGCLGFASGRLHAWRQWPGRFRVRRAQSGPQQNTLAELDIVRPPKFGHAEKR